MVSAVAGSAYLVKHYAEKKFFEWQEREMEQLLERSRKQQHFESTERTCNLTVTSVMLKVESQISRTLDSDAITLLLKNKAPNKKELWDQLKVIAFSRIMAHVYSNTLLVVLLRTQITILGANLYKANKHPEDDSLELSPNLQNQFLSATNHWLTTGVEQLCELMEKVMTEQVAGVSLKDKMTLTELERLLQDGRIAIENEMSTRGDVLVRLMLPHPAVPQDESVVGGLGRMMADTRDVLESREVADLVSNCASAGVSCVLDMLAESMHSLADPQPTDAPAANFVHPNRSAVFVAKLIPVLNNLIHSDAWLQQLLKMDSLRTFGANIYESFSH